MSIQENIKQLIQGEKYYFCVEALDEYQNDLLAIPENDEFELVVVENGTNAGKQTIQCLTDWWNEQNGW